MDYVLSSGSSAHRPCNIELGSTLLGLCSLICKVGDTMTLMKMQVQNLARGLGPGRCPANPGSSGSPLCSTLDAPPVIYTPSH